MTVKDDIWEFALRHPDYWELLRADDTPKELDGLEQADVDAFHAARREVQRRLLSLVRACVAAVEPGMQKLAGRPWSWRPQEGTILGNKVRAALPRHRAWLFVTTGAHGDRVALYASIWVAKKRYSEARAILSHATEANGSLHYAVDLDPGASDVDMASRFVGAFQSQLLEFLASDLNADESDEAPPDSGGAP